MLGFTCSDKVCYVLYYPVGFRALLWHGAWGLTYLVFWLAPVVIRLLPARPLRLSGPGYPAWPSGWSNSPLGSCSKIVGFSIA